MSVRLIHPSSFAWACEKREHLTFQTWVDCGEWGWAMQVECARCGQLEVWDRQ